MTDPITLTTAGIVALAASKFVEKAAEKAGETVAPAILQGAGSQIDKLWGRIKQHFSGNQRAETAMVQVEQEQSEAALTKLEVYLDDEMTDPENQAFAQELQQMAQQIINVEIGEQNQSQNQTTFNIDATGKARVNAVNEVNADTVNFGDTRS